MFPLILTVLYEDYSTPLWTVSIRGEDVPRLRGRGLGRTALDTVVLSSPRKPSTTSSIRRVRRGPGGSDGVMPWPGWKAGRSTMK